MNFYGEAKKIDDLDLPKLGQLIGVGEDELHAFIDVETSGGGFDDQGRPKMLFEPHKFYSELGDGVRRERAVKAGLAYPRWGQSRYPRDSYPRLIQAMEIHKEAALRSASWGMGQVMGYHAEALGYRDVFEMVEKFTHDEEEHLRAAIEFIRVNGLDDELRAHNWAAFARGYNGSGYRKNRYDIKLAMAFNKWRRIPDTTFRPSGDTFFASAMNMLRRGDRGEDVRKLIGWLFDLGYYRGVKDDVFGRGTEAALMAFQKDNGLTVDGIAGKKTLTAIEKKFA